MNLRSVLNIMGIILAVVLGYYARIEHIPFYIPLVVIVVVYSIAFILPKITVSLEKSAIKYFLDKFLETGFVPRIYVRYQILLLQILLFVFILLLSITTVIPLEYSPIALIVVVVLIIVTLLLPTLIASVRTSVRKTSVEIEFPLLLTTMRVFSTTHITLYELLELVSKSFSLKAWSKEIKLAMNIANIYGTSLFSALSLLSEKHPSKLVRTMFKRIITVGTLTGTVRDIVERVFQKTYMEFEDKISSLVEKVSLVFATLVSSIFFLIASLIIYTPITKMTVYDLAYIVIGISVPVSLTVYLIVTALVPSMFFISVPRQYFMVFSVFTGIGLLFLIYVLVFQEVSLPVEHVIIIPALFFTVSAIVSEVYYRRVKEYNNLLSDIADATDISYATGENMITVLERYSEKQRNRLLRILVSSYHNELFRRVLVERAPTLLHANLIENIIQGLRWGARPDVLKTILSLYDKLVGVFKKTLSTSTFMEATIHIMVVLTAVMMSFIRNIFTYFQETMQTGSTVTVSVTSIILNVVNYSYEVFLGGVVILLIASTIISLPLGKVKGSIVFSSRAILVNTLLVYVGLRIGEIVSRFFFT